MPKDVKGPSAIHTRPSSFLSLLSGWVQQGVESFLATQRILVDTAMQKNATAMKSLSDPEHSPRAILTEVAVEGTANLIEAQRILLNLAQQENDIVMNGVKERVGSNRAMAAVDLLRRSIDTFVDMQQEFLTITSKHTQKWLQPAKGGKGTDGFRVFDLAREGMENFIHAQKKFLDVVLEETEKATSGKQDQASKKMHKTELTKLAREAANSFIDAQKKLLDVAGQQMNVNRQAISHARDLLAPFQLLPMADLTGKGMKSFVDAEKALIDSIREPRQPKVAAKAKRRKRPTRQRKVQVAKAARAGA